MFQDSQHAVFAIEESVEKVNRIARQHYREGELYPSMQDLVEASATTVTLMGDLNKSLQCQHLFRSVQPQRCQTLFYILLHIS